MSTGKLLVYVVVALVALLVLSTVVSAVFAAIAFIQFLIRVLVFLLVAGGLGYVVYRLHALLNRSSDDSATADTADIAGGTEMDELHRQYLAGEISEEEFERRLERELDGGEFDSIDREFQRERI